MRKFRVLLVVPLDNVAGAEVSTLYLAKGLRENGHQITLLCSRGPLADEFNGLGIKVVEGMVNLRGPWGLLKGAHEIRKCLLSGESEIVHVQNGFLVPAAFLAARGVGRGRVAIVWHCRGIKNVNYVIAGRLFNYLTDFVIANCESERRRLVGNGLKLHKIRTIYNCLNMSLPGDMVAKDSDLLKELGVSVDTPLVGTVGQLAEYKGIRFLLEAAPVILRESPNVKFIIVGHGPLDERLKIQARDLGIADRVMFLGARRDIHRIYSIIDVLAVPSLAGEATNNPVAEAMAFAKPVVASDIGGIPELVQHGESGILVPPRDSRKLAEAILLVLRDKDLSKRIGNAGRGKIMRDFSVGRLVREVEEVYEHVTDRRNNRGDVHDRKRKEN